MKSLVRSSFQISQDYYPETMGRLLVINAPTSFTAIWSVVKPWLAKETVAKIDILGNDYKKVLLEVVDEQNLPVMFGGKCRCGGEMAEGPGGGCELSSAGPWIDERRRKAAEQEETKVVSSENGNASVGNDDTTPNFQSNSDSLSITRTSIEGSERAASEGAPSSSAN